MREALGDVDPMKHAGENWTATDEIARADDIDNPYIRGEVGREGEYYPPPTARRSRFTP